MFLSYPFRKTRYILIKYKLLLHNSVFIRCKLACLAINAEVASYTCAVVGVDVINTSGTILAR
jgi:hypothetical protein